MLSWRGCEKPHWGGGISASLSSLLFFKFIPAASITQSQPILTLLFLLLSAEKPMPQGPPGGVIGILGGVVAIGLIIGVAVTVFMVHRRQQKTRTETDNDLWVPSLCLRTLHKAGQVLRLGVPFVCPWEKHFQKADKNRDNAFGDRGPHWEQASVSFSPRTDNLLSYIVGPSVENNVTAPRLKKKTLSLFSAADRIDD